VAYVPETGLIMMPLDVMIRLPAGTVWTLLADRASVMKVPLGSSRRPGPEPAGSACSEAATVGCPGCMFCFADPPAALFRLCSVVWCARNLVGCPAARVTLIRPGLGWVGIAEGEAKADVAGRANVAPATPATTIFAPSPPGMAARSPTVHDGSLRCCGACRLLVPAAFVLLLMIGVSL
jgi:hypothetical protein